MSRSGALQWVVTPAGDRRHGDRGCAMAILAMPEGEREARNDPGRTPMDRGK